jgi:hypothetical protein
LLGKFGSYLWWHFIHSISVSMIGQSMTIFLRFVDEAKREYAFGNLR